MMGRMAWLIAGVVTVASFGGCGIGVNETLFVTKTNIGLDADTRPPTLELSIGRREAVIAPTFERGKTPPVLASFQAEHEGPLAIFGAVSATFAGGDAAIVLSDLYDEAYCPDLQTRLASGEYDSGLSLAQKPTKTTGWFGEEQEVGKLLEPGDVRPLLFGTDTMFGLKVGWSGMTAGVPDTVKLGYNRKEFALAPVTISKKTCGRDCAECQAGGGEVACEGDDCIAIFSVKMPSFLATIDNSRELARASDTQIKHLQYFATGKAANLLALRREVRKAMVHRLDPRAEFGVSSFERSVTLTMLSQVYDALRAGDDEAKKLADGLDALDRLVPDKYPVSIYGSAVDGALTAGRLEGDQPDRSNSGFDLVSEYWGSIQNSEDSLSQGIYDLRALGALTTKQRIELSGLESEYERVKRANAEFGAQLTQTREVAEVFRYWMQIYYH